MNTIFKQPFVKNAFAATHGDISTGGGYLNIAGCPSSYIPGSVCTIQPSLVETPYTLTVTPNTTVANNNSFIIGQFNRALGVNQNYEFVDTVITGDTATTITTRIKAFINAVNLAGGGSLNVTVSGTTTAIIVAGAGDPFFTFNNLGNATTNAATSMNSTRTIASNTTANPSVITCSGAPDFVVGSVITITSADNTKLQSGTYRVASISTNDITLTSLDGGTTLGGTSTTTATIKKVVQNSVGTSAKVVTAGTTQLPLGGSTPVSGDTYTTFTVLGYEPSNDTITSKVNQGFTQVYYFDEAGANFSDFITQLYLEAARQVTAGVVDSGLVS